MTLNTCQIAFIGFGEVAQTFARDLLSRGDVAITGYDVLLGGPGGDLLRSRASALGVTLAETLEDATRAATIVISAVTASEAETVAQASSPFLSRDQIFFDLNSAAPSTKQRAARHVEPSGAHYVEAAVMAPVLKPGIRVPILVGGPHAHAAAERLNGLGMNLTSVATEYGRASAMKLCRSIMIKGIEALMVDCTAACESWQVKEQVFGSLAETFPSIDWYSLSDNMRERVATHGVRRSAEMYEAGEMLAALEMDPSLANAVAAAQLRGAKPKGAL
ncbi:MmsB 3-hydroxyisobutyrate dehydrogenase and related beta-hydroxyacid dehydrogenases [Rhabdaerophilaceae bacterium]